MIILQQGPDNPPPHPRLGHGSSLARSVPLWTAFMGTAMEQHTRCPSLNPYVVCIIYRYVISCRQHMAAMAPCLVLLYRAASA
jgi:hypothetical protein